MAEQTTLICPDWRRRAGGPAGGSRCAASAPFHECRSAASVCFHSLVHEEEKQPWHDQSADLDLAAKRPSAKPAVNDDVQWNDIRERVFISWLKWFAFSSPGGATRSLDFDRWLDALAEVETANRPCSPGRGMSCPPGRSPLGVARLYPRAVCRGADQPAAGPTGGHARMRSIWRTSS